MFQDKLYNYPLAHKSNETVRSTMSIGIGAYCVVFYDIGEAIRESSDCELFFLNILEFLIMNIAVNLIGSVATSLSSLAF